MFLHGTHGGPVGIVIFVAVIALRMLMRGRSGGGRRRPPRGPWGM